MDDLSKQEKVSAPTPEDVKEKPHRVDNPLPLDSLIREREYVRPPKELDGISEV